MQIFPIFYKNLFGVTRVLQITNDTTVDEVTSMIEIKEGVPIGQQRIIHQGKHLEVGRTASDYKLKPDSTIHLVLQLRGCACGCGLYPPWADENDVVKSEEGLAIVGQA